MESEARLVMIDYGLPLPELQYEIRALDGTVHRVDFAWPEQRVVAEYESIDWHSGRIEMVRDKKRYADLQDLRLTVIPIVVERCPTRTLALGSPPRVSLVAAEDG